MQLLPYPGMVQSCAPMGALCMGPSFWINDPAPYHERLTYSSISLSYFLTGLPHNIDHINQAQNLTSQTKVSIYQKPHPQCPEVILRARRVALKSTARERHADHVESRVLFSFVGWQWCADLDM